MNRRHFFRQAAGAASITTLPLTMVELAFAQPADNFSFAYISDAHLQQVKGTEFVHHWDRGLRNAIDETNLLGAKPDFVVFGGDLAQSGTRAELDHGAELLARLNAKIYHVIGEHDYYHDLGENWSRLFGAQYYSFDHKGVHFVVLNSILTDHDWTHRRWSTAAQRMQAITGLSNPDSSPFMVGDSQRAWLARDLAAVAHRTPVVVFSHAPLQKIHQSWNFWTEDAEQVQQLLAPFDKSTVVYGHVHQVQYNRIGNTSFHSVTATSWPWPYPQAASGAQAMLPKLTVPMNRSGGALERDTTGWQILDLSNGNVAMNYKLDGARSRNVAIHRRSGAVRDSEKLVAMVA